MPTVNETRVRSDCLSNSTATARGPASGCQPNLSFFIRSARSRTVGLLGGRQVVIAQEVPGHELDLRVEDPGQRGDELVGLRSGQDQRRCQPDRVGLDRVDQEPGPPGGRLDVGGHLGR